MGGGRGLGEMDIWLQNLVSEKIMRWRKGLWIGGVDEKGTCGDSDIMSCRWWLVYVDQQHDGVVKLALKHEQLHGQVSLEESRNSFLKYFS